MITTNGTYPWSLVIQIFCTNNQAMVGIVNHSKCWLQLNHWPERCIDNIGSPSVQRRRPATLSGSGTALHSMRWQRPPFQRWYGTCTDSRPQPSRSTCLLVLSYGTSRLECCGITILARTTPDFFMFHTSSEQKKTWRGFWRSWADMTSWSTSCSRDPIPSGSFICWPTWPST